MNLQNRSYIPHGCKNMIELGVAAGKSAQAFLLANSELTYTGIDRWSDHHDAKEMQEAKDRLQEFGVRAVLIQSTFSEAATLIADESVDCIYIDGYAHTGQDSGRTLREWFPKLRVGGIFSGHDYSKRYPLTKREVNKFVADVGASLNVITEPEGYDSWWFIKE
jgi:predicted O-methyltransferase YrrM